MTKKKFAKLARRLGFNTRYNGKTKVFHLVPMGPFARFDLIENLSRRWSYGTEIIKL